MSKQLSPRSYRKIWEDHFGPIPRDSSGRTYEIHHIDGDHSNCDISNLKLVTIQEHYDLHYAQGDWGACFMMGERMRLSYEVLSDLSRKTQLARVEAGTHHWQGSAHNEKMIADGIHPFLDKAAARERNLKRIADGTHNLLTDANPSKVLIKAGKHHFQLDNPTHKKLKAGTHPFQVNHQNKIQVTCLCCKKTGGLVNMQRYHLSNCKVAKILPG